MTSLDYPCSRASAAEAFPLHSVGAFPLESPGDFPAGNSVVVVAVVAVAVAAATLHSQKTTTNKIRCSYMTFEKNSIISTNINHR